MALPSITDSTEPVSLSKAVFRGLLHDTLGYSDVAVADVGSRSALGRPPSIAVDALRAGVDIA